MVFCSSRLVGDLIYLDVETLEGNKFCITGTTRMFYVNSSTGNTLDPRPSKSSLEATTLIGLLQKISLKFKKGNNVCLWHSYFCCNWSDILCHYLSGQFIVSVSHIEAFREILEQKASAHPFENVQSLLPPNSWLGFYPVPGNIQTLKRFYNDFKCMIMWCQLLKFWKWFPDLFYVVSM